MSNDNEKNGGVSVAYRPVWRFDQGGHANILLTKRKRSVRELERIVSDLRHAGEHHAIERIDLEIMSLLERKIFRKVIAKSRRERLATRGSC